MRGFIDFLDMNDIELIGSISAFGNHCLITEECFDDVTGFMLDNLEKYQVPAKEMYSRNCIACPGKGI